MDFQFEEKIDEDESTIARAAAAAAEEAAQAKAAADAQSEQEVLANNQVPASSKGVTCYHQRSALLKSILNFFKKVIADSSNNNVPNLGDSIRHMMDNSLPNSLKHIISNADYYGPSLFLLATDVVQLFIFQEPSQLSQLQENGLTDVILFALLKKNVPATREVLGSLPTVFSALCLNTNGLNAFIESKPFDKLFQVLLSPNYLPAMRRRRNADQLNAAAAAAAAAAGGGANGLASSTSTGTATQLGNAMDELMRHQPSLRVEAMNSIIKLLNQLIEMGRNPNYVCQRQSSSSSSSSSTGAYSLSGHKTAAATTTPTPTPTPTATTTATAATTTPTTSGSARRRSTSTTGRETASTTATVAEETTTQTADTESQMDESTVGDGQQQQPGEKKSAATVTQQQQQQQQQPECIPLLDYITNIMKFVEAILSNNSTDDHCKEFVKQRGLVPLMQILSLPNLPIDFATSAACQSVAQVCKAILHLAREPQVIDQALSSLADALIKCEKLFDSYLYADNEQPGKQKPTETDAGIQGVSQIAIANFMFNYISIFFVVLAVD